MSGCVKHSAYPAPTTTQIARMGITAEVLSGDVRMLDHRKTGSGIGRPVSILPRLENTGGTPIRNQWVKARE